MTRRKSNLKVAISVISFIMIAVCLVLAFWYYYIAVYGEQKIVINSFNVDSLTMSDGSQQKIVKVNYFSNKNENGLEMFEIQLNYFTDETRTSYYSNGLQFVANKVGDRLKWDYYADNAPEIKYSRTGSFWEGYKDRWEKYGTYNIDSNQATLYNYGAEKDSPFGPSESPITENSLFRIEIGGEIYAMSFRGKGAGHAECYASQTMGVTFEEWWTVTDKRLDYYFSYDINYYAHLLYEKVKSFPGGTSGDYTFEFLDLFDYKKWDGSVYKDTIERDEIVKVQTYVVNNYSIQVTTSDDGAQIASDSIFNLVHEDPTYRISNDVFDDYYYGDTIIKADIYDFDFIKILNKNVVLKLKDEFVNYYSQYAKLLVLSVEIDIDKIESLGYIYCGFAENSGLENFKVKEIYTIKDGQREEVKL